MSHAQRVVEHMLQNSSLLKFQARWRRHFVSTMNPQFLPAYWSVDYIPENWNVGIGDSSGDEVEEQEGEEEEEEGVDEKYQEKLGGEEEEDGVEFEEEGDGSDSLDEVEDDEELGER